jgi:hypothetical protein
VKPYSNVECRCAFPPKGRKARDMYRRAFAIVQAAAICCAFVLIPRSTSLAQSNIAITRPEWTEWGHPRLVRNILITCGWTAPLGASDYKFYLDGRPVTVVDFEFKSSPSPSARLFAPVGPGAHALEVAAVVQGVEGPRSTPAPIDVPGEFVAPILYLAEPFGPRATFVWSLPVEECDSLISVSDKEVGPFASLALISAISPPSFSVITDIYDGHPPDAKAWCGTPFIREKPSWWRVSITCKSGLKTEPSNVVRLSYAWRR